MAIPLSLSQPCDVQGNQTEILVVAKKRQRTYQQRTSPDVPAGVKKIKRQ
jgi:hypothetical protein